MKKFTKNSRGFTLIELLVVIAIIGILSAIVLASLSTARSKGKDAALEEQMSGARSQMELYAEGNGNSYAGGCSGTVANNGLGNGTAGITQGIMTDVPSTASAGWTVNSGTESATKVTCTDTGGATWVLQAPLNSPTGTNLYWCVDNSGDSRADIAGGANPTVCP